MSAGSAWAVAPLDRVLAAWDLLAVRWELDCGERSSLLGSVGGPIDEVSSYDPASAERRIRLLVALDPVLQKVFADDATTRLWLRRENRNLSGRTPLDVMSSSPEWIRWLIDSLGIAA